MTNKYDLKKEWPKIKKKLKEMSKEAAVLARKGEDELIKLSKKSKLHLDAATVALRKEKLFYEIGKEYVRAKCPAQKTAKIQKMVDELDHWEKEERALKRKIKEAGKAG